MLEKINTDEKTFVRKFRLGTQFISEVGTTFKYAKIDFGISGKIEGKTIRNIQYGWIRI
jgi:hypothetical protein